MFWLASIGFLIASVVVLAAITYGIGVSCQWLRRRTGLDDDALPPGGFEVTLSNPAAAAPRQAPQDPPAFLRTSDD